MAPFFLLKYKLKYSKPYNITKPMFILVMKIVLKSTETKDAEVKTTFKAFMDDITILSKSKPATRYMHKRLDDLISWSRINFSAEGSQVYNSWRPNTNGERGASQRSLGRLYCMPQKKRAQFRALFFSN